MAAPITLRVGIRSAFQQQSSNLQVVTAMPMSIRIIDTNVTGRPYYDVQSGKTVIILGLKISAAIQQRRNNGEVSIRYCIMQWGSTPHSIISCIHVGAFADFGIQIGNAGVQPECGLAQTAAVVGAGFGIRCLHRRLGLRYRRSHGRRWRLGRGICSRRIADDAAGYAAAAGENRRR